MKQVQIKWTSTEEEILKSNYNKISYKTKSFDAVSFFGNFLE